MSGQNNLISFRDLRAGLQARALDLARELLPDGRRNGNYWIAKNPTRDDRSAGSFYVWVKGAAAGGFRDDASGDKGDCIDLIVYVTGFEILAAKQWGERWLGLSNIKPEEIKRQRKINDQKSRERDAQDQLALEKNRGSAKAMWLAAKRLQPGDPIDEYLFKRRGIDLFSSKIPANAIRFSQSMKHYESGQSFRCMIAAMSDASGQIIAVHRTWLDWNYEIMLPDKANVKPPRKIWPAFAGSVIRIHKGGTGLSPEDAKKKGIKSPCVITEGVEDGLAVAISRPDLRVWAAGSLGNLANVPRLPCVSEFIVCQDNDWGKPQAQKQFDRAIISLAATGVRVSIARSWIGKDANDLLKGDNNE